MAPRKTSTPAPISTKKDAPTHRSTHADAPPTPAPTHSTPAKTEVKTSPYDDEPLQLPSFLSPSAPKVSVGDIQEAEQNEEPLNMDGLVSLTRRDFESLAARLEDSEERMVFLRGICHRLKTSLSIMEAQQTSNEQLLQQLSLDIQGNKVESGQLATKVQTLMTQNEQFIRQLGTVASTVSTQASRAPRRAVMAPPLLSYKTLTPGEHTLNVTLGTATETKRYALTGASVAASAVFVVTESSDGSRFVLSQEGEDFPAYQDLCPRVVSLAHMLHICFPDGKFTFHEVNVL
jgi:hypothetical protein